MRVSIIIPVYNSAKFIERCLQSVFNQTYPNIECIIVDDCGIDGSMNLAKDVINDYRGNISFKYLYHEKNKGQSAARNTALRKVTGKYVFFLDSDDTIPSDSIETLMATATKHPDADFIQGNLLDETGRISKYGWNTILPEYCNTRDELEHYILSTVVFSAWNKVIKTSFIKKHDLYFPEGIIHEDLYWTYYLAKYAKAVGFINKGTYTYFTNANSTITNKSIDARIKRYTSRLIASNAFFADIKKQQETSRYQRLFIAGNLTSAMIEVAALHSLKHWCIFWQHVFRLYSSRTNLTIWQHTLFLFMMPPLCFPIRIKGWYWRVQRYIVNKI